MPSQTPGELHLQRVHSACAALLDATEAHRVSVWAHDPASTSVSPLVSAGADVPPTAARRWSRLPVRDLGALARVLDDGRPVLMDDLEAPGMPAAVCRDFGMSSAWIGGLVVGDQILGMLVVEPLDQAVHARLDDHVAAVAAALSEARAWYLAERRQAELDLLLDLTRSAVEASADGRAIDHLCQRLAQHLQISRACLFLAEDGGLVAAHAHHADGSVDRDGYRAFTTAGPPPVVVEAFRTGTPVVLHETVADRRDSWWLDTFGVGSAVAIPIRSGDEALGVLTLDDPRPRRFNDRMLALAEAAAAHFGLLYERARILDEQARAMRSAAAVRRLLREGSAARSTVAATEVVARVGLAALDAEHAVALVFDDAARIVAVDTVGLEEPWVSELEERLMGLSALDISLGRKVIDERTPVVVVDARKDPLIPSGLLENMVVRSYVAMPLTSSQRVAGAVLFTSSTTQRRWSRADRALIEQLMLECDLIIENAALREAEEERTRALSWQALHDSLTGLPNRALLDDRLATALRATSRSGGRAAVLFVDLHRFKQVNDRFGHEVGDDVLVELAKRFSGAVRPGDTVGRLAGDEFLVVLPEAETEDAMAVAARICDVAAAPMRVGTGDVTVGTSIGIALGDHADDPAAVLRRADTAMYRAKRDLGHGYAVADEVPAATRGEA
ncbi:MAG: diguanylate cyclase domain-containing protein [Acidimicrobiia bacterium]